MIFLTSPGKTYSVNSVGGCTISAGGTTLATIPANVQTTFIAPEEEVLVSDDNAIIVEVTGVGAGGSGGSGEGGSGGVSGEPIIQISSDVLTISHSTWHDNTTQSSITVNPAPWKNEVMTCYIKTSIPVELSGVTWLYGQPFMAEGYTYVIAIQQIDASAVLANLAYSLPQ